MTDLHFFAKCFLNASKKELIFHTKNPLR